jgi:hypothetical protein
VLAAVAEREREDVSPIRILKTKDSRSGRRELYVPGVTEKLRAGCDLRHTAFFALSQARLGDPILPILRTRRREKYLKIAPLSPFRAQQKLQTIS